MALHAIAVDTDAADQDIVNNRKAALASDPVALAIAQTTVRQDCSLVEAHAAVVLGFR